MPISLILIVILVSLVIGPIVLYATTKLFRFKNTGGLKCLVFWFLQLIVIFVISITISKLLIWSTQANIIPAKEVVQIQGVIYAVVSSILTVALMKWWFKESILKVITTYIATTALFSVAAIFCLLILLPASISDECINPFDIYLRTSGVPYEGSIKKGDSFLLRYDMSTSPDYDLQDITVRVNLPPELEITSNMNDKNETDVHITKGGAEWRDNLKYYFWHRFTGWTPDKDFVIEVRSKTDWEKWSYPVETHYSLYLKGPNRCNSYSDGYYKKTLKLSASGTDRSDWEMRTDYPGVYHDDILPFFAGPEVIYGVSPLESIKAGTNFGMHIVVGRVFLHHDGEIISDISIDVSFPPEIELDPLSQKIFETGMPGRLEWKADLETDNKRDIELWFFSKTEMEQWSSPLQIDIRLYYMDTYLHGLHGNPIGDYTKTITWSKYGYEDKGWVERGKHKVLDAVFIKRMRIDKVFAEEQRLIIENHEGKKSIVRTGDFIAEGYQLTKVSEDRVIFKEKTGGDTFLLSIDSED